MPRGMHRRPKVEAGETCWLCTKCKSWKLADGFFKDKSMVDGLSYWCSDCHSAANARRTPEQLDRKKASNRAAYRKNKEIRRLNNAKYRQDNEARIRDKRRKRDRDTPERSRANAAIKRAKKRGDIKVPDHCECCPGDGKVEAHHDSYDRDRWLVVTWMCRKCHLWMHARWDEQAKARERKKAESL